MTQQRLFSFADQQSKRGYFVPYRDGTRCPGCGRSHWYIGRMSAECGFCGTALDLPRSVRGPGLFTGTKTSTA